MSKLATERKFGAFMKRSDIVDNSTHNDILMHLQKEGSITGADAYWTYGCYRLAVVISRLREKHIIKTIMMDGKNKNGRKTRYAKYVYVGVKDNAERKNC
jgi:hypothetical protein